MKDRMPVDKSISKLVAPECSDAILGRPKTSHFQWDWEVDYYHGLIGDYSFTLLD